MIERVQIGEGRNRRVGTCGWCGKRKVPRRYTVYQEDGQLYTAELCERCLEECQRRLRWEGQHDGLETDA